MRNHFPNPYPVIQGIKVDLVNLLSIKHDCQPVHCKQRKSCCQTYEVLVDKDQWNNITGAMSGARKFAPHLKEDGEYIEPFDDTDGGTCLQADEDGLCVFAFKGPSDEILCSLHAAALKWEIEPIQVKPRSCVLWPLALVESTPSFLTVQGDAMEFLCNTPADTNETRLDTEVASIISTVFGREFLTELNARIAS
jgi:hypothetical protein